MNMLTAKGHIFDSRVHGATNLLAHNKQGRIYFYHCINCTLVVSYRGWYDAGLEYYDNKGKGNLYLIEHFSCNEMIIKGIIE